ncbi:MAG TPA: hypothetical protein VN366_04475 [Feifaniaceae bacterium]|nr:hypothetical protein [Feifaniaceae bacterium]
MKTPLTTVAEIHGACRKMGLAPLDFGGPGEYEKNYAGYTWYLIPFWRVKWVLYSVPAKENLLRQPWESFYIETDGKESHHVHYAEKKHEDDRTWIQETDTDERPDEIIGRLWYWYDEPGMKPALLL